MTYHQRELLVSRSSQSQQPHLQKRIFFNNTKPPSRLLPPQSLRVECKSEERHFITDISPCTIDLSLKPIRFRMNEQHKPVQFRSEIIVHNNPETDLHIRRLHVAFHYHDDLPGDAMSGHHAPAERSHSLHLPNYSPSKRQQELKVNNTKRRTQPVASSQSQALLHRWIDDICMNEKLMDNDDIVFFIKNGEFFARI
jgi:hypothetical protein